MADAYLRPEHPWLDGFPFVNGTNCTDQRPGAGGDKQGRGGRGERPSRLARLKLVAEKQDQLAIVGYVRNW